MKKQLLSILALTAAFVINNALQASEAEEIPFLELQMNFNMAYQEFKPWDDKLHRATGYNYKAFLQLLNDRKSASREAQQLPFAGLGLGIGEMTDQIRYIRQSQFFDEANQAYQKVAKTKQPLEQRLTQAVEDAQTLLAKKKPFLLNPNRKAILQERSQNAVELKTILEDSIETLEPVLSDEYMTTVIDILNRLRIAFPERTTE